MPLALNTSHPLYSAITAFICVDDDNTIKDLKEAQTCTTDAAVTLGTGAYGRHFTTTIVSNNAKGVTLAPGIANKTFANPSQTSFVVVNNVNSVVGTRGQILQSGLTGDDASWSIGLTSTGLVKLTTGSNTNTTPGTTVTLANGAHSLVGYVDNTTSWGAGVDGIIETSGATSHGSTSDIRLGKTIGGYPSGGFGGTAADYVYFVQFNRVLTPTEIEDLHASLGSGNTFALLESSGDVAVTFTGTIPAQSATVGTPFSLNAASYFSGTQTPFSYAIHSGTLPDGLSFDTAACIISGTPTSAEAQPIVIRGTDADSDTADSNSFTITVSDAGSPPAGTFTVGTITVTQTTASVPYTYSAADETGIEYRLDGGSAATATASPQDLTGLTAGTTYGIQFRAVNGFGNGSWSTSAPFTTESTPSFTLTDLVNNAGAPIASTGSITVDVYNPSTGALVVRKTGLTSTSGADVVVSDAALVADTTYNVFITIGSAIGAVKATAE